MSCFQFCLNFAFKFNLRRYTVVAAGLALLQRLKTNIEDATDAAIRESALQTFAASAAALPYADALTAALIQILRRLDDTDAGVRACAVGLVRAAAARRGVRPRELLLNNRVAGAYTRPLFSST
jgi:hypothetical protein